MTSELQRVAQELVACLDQMPSVAAALVERARKCRDASGYLAGLSSGDPHLQAAVHYLDAAANDCEKAADDALTANRQARDWAMSMVGTMTSGGRGSAAPRQMTTRRNARHNPELPKAVVERNLGKLPERQPKDKTRGIWVGPDGVEYPLVSGKNDQYYRKADELAKELDIPPPMATSHVELKFAMFMRERGLKNESIVINNPPCSEGGLSCNTLLKDFLPAGARLTIYAPGFKQTYPIINEDSE